MAMRFSQAQAAENPDLARALAMQQQMANELKAAEMQADAQNTASYMQGGAMLAQAAPEGTFNDAWDTATRDPQTFGNFSTAGEGASAITPEALGADFAMGAETGAGGLEAALSGDAIASGIGLDTAAAGAGSEALGAEALAAGMQAAPVAEGAAGVEAALAASQGTGMQAALAGMGPMGWAALAALSVPALKELF